MDAIFCNNCGAELDEAPTLLPDRRPPCSRCGSLARPPSAGHQYNCSGQIRS
jgi:hypothetical protein